jgi:hypothetical protein
MRIAILMRTAAGICDRHKLEDFLSEQGSALDPDDFAEVEALLNEPATWSRLVRLAEALVVQHYMDDLDAYLT